LIRQLFEFENLFLHLAVHAFSHCIAFHRCCTSLVWGVACRCWLGKQVFSACFSWTLLDGTGTVIWIRSEWFIAVCVWAAVKPSRSASRCPLVYEFWLSGSVVVLWCQHSALCLVWLNKACQSWIWRTSLCQDENTCRVLLSCVLCRGELSYCGKVNMSTHIYFFRDAPLWILSTGTDSHKELLHDLVFLMEKKNLSQVMQTTQITFSFVTL